jgi:copper chaperone
METTTIKVDGMSCGGCVKSVTGVLTALDGVAKAEVSLEQKQAVVEFDAAKLTREQLKTVIEDAGFDARLKAQSALAGRREHARERLEDSARRSTNPRAERGRIPGTVAPERTARTPAFSRPA